MDDENCVEVRRMSGNNFDVVTLRSLITGEEFQIYCNPGTLELSDYWDKSDRSSPSRFGT